MKAKHAMACMKSSSVWIKIFCVLMAVSLFALMVSNGLYSYADEMNDKQIQNENQNDIIKGGDNTKIESEDNSLEALPWLQQNTKVSFSVSGVNVEETSGQLHFDRLTDDDEDPQKIVRDEFDTANYNDEEFPVSNLTYDNEFHFTADGKIHYAQEHTYYNMHGKYNYEINTIIWPILPGFFNETNNNDLSADNTAAFFAGWEVSINEGPYWNVTLAGLNELSIIPGFSYQFKARFYDVTGLSPVILDFDGAMLSEGFSAVLQANGWSENSLMGDKWVKWVPSYLSKYVFLGTFFNTYGNLLFNYDETGKIKTWNIAKDLYLGFAWTIIGADVVNPCPYNFECSNPSDFMDQETILKFSAYPVCPRGYVQHRLGNAQSKNIENGTVQFFNEWGFPLFWKPAQIVNGEYNFSSAPLETQYCFDTEIAYGIASGWDSSTSFNFYMPKKVMANEFEKAMDPEIIFCVNAYNFYLEKLYLADVNTFMQGDLIDSIEITYYQDGNMLGSPYVVSNPWEMAMLSVPMTTNGTITTGDNRLVTGFSSNMDFVRPFGEVDMLNAFSADNFEASDTSHWYQCQIKVNVKAGRTFGNFTYDFRPISADTFKGEPAIIVEDTIFFPNHVIGMKID